MLYITHAAGSLAQNELKLTLHFSACCCCSGGTTDLSMLQQQAQTVLVNLSPFYCIICCNRSLALVTTA